MARWPRLIAPGYPMHLTQRGHNRGITFHDDQDFGCFRAILADASERAHCAVHAYALMSNHIHLLLTPSERTSPSRLMQRVGSRFVRYANKRHQRTGTLWEGRFRSSIVDTDRYFLACCRYIDLNPVRAGIVPHADDYIWSSHGTLAHGIDDGLVTPHATYLALGASAAMRQSAYRRFCSIALPPETTGALRIGSRLGTVVGDPRFQRQLETVLKRPTTRLEHGGDRKSQRWLASVRG